MLWGLLFSFFIPYPHSDTIEVRAALRDHHVQKYGMSQHCTGALALLPRLKKAAMSKNSCRVWNSHCTWIPTTCHPLPSPPPPPTLCFPQQPSSPQSAYCTTLVPEQHSKLYCRILLYSTGHFHLAKNEQWHGLITSAYNNIQIEPL